MATYLQGVTDYIPQIQPFQPDYNFYMNVLQAKQNQYDTNYKNINNLYGQLYNNAVTRDDSAKMKEDYLKKIDFELKRVSALDLSLDQNVMQATQVFKPFYENDHLMKDMALTKNFNNAVRNAMALANSKDEKVRSTYWDDGIKAMQYRLEEFKNAKAEEVLSFANITYTPYANAQKKFLDMAKEYNLSVDITQPDKTGMYMIRQKNGELLIPSLQKMFMNAYVNDPELQKVYATQAYVNRKNEIEFRSKKFNGDKVAAENDYLQENYKSLKIDAEKKAEEANNSYTVTKNKNNSVENDKNMGDVHPKQNSYLQRLQQTLQVESFVKANADKINEDLNGQSYTSTTNGPDENVGGLDLKNIELARNKVDAAYANTLAERDINAASEIYSNNGRIYDVKVNPIGLESLRHQHNMQRDAAQNAFTTNRDRMKMEFEMAKIKDDQEFKIKLEEAKIKAEEDKQYHQHLLDIGAAYYDKEGKFKIKDNNQHKVPMTPGGTTSLSIDLRKKYAENLFEQVDANATGFVSQFINSIANGIEGSAPEISNAELGNILGVSADKARAKFSEIKKQYYTNPAKAVKELTLGGHMFNYKDKFDRWCFANDGTSISRKYLSNTENASKFEDVRQYFKVYKEDKKHNYTTVITNLKSSLAGANLSDQVVNEVVNLYEKKYLTGKIDAGDFEDYVEDYIINRKNLQGKISKEKVRYEKGYKTVTDEFGVSQRIPYETAINPSIKNGKKIFKLLDDAYHTTIKNGDPKTGMRTPFKTIDNGKGQREFAAYPTSIDVNLAHKGSDGYTFFAQTVEDLQRIRFGNTDGMHGVSLQGPNRVDKDQLIAADNINKYKRLVQDLLFSGASRSKQKGDPTQFTIVQHQIALENDKVGAMTINFPREFLEKQLKNGDYKIDADEVEQIYKNGITFIAPHSSWKNGMFASNKMDPMQAILNSRKKMTYTSPDNSGSFTIEFNPQDESYRYNAVCNLIDGEGNVSKKIDNNTQQIFGNNLKSFKDELIASIAAASNYNNDVYKKFHTSGETEKMKKADQFFGITPKNAGFTYGN